MLPGGANQFPGGVALTESQRLFTAHCYANYAALGCDNPTDRTPKEWVTYVSIPEATLWRSKLNGSARLHLSYAPMRTALAHWSPDGQQIAFSGTAPGKPWKVFLISKDGGSPQAVTPEEGRETDPTWPPDGNTLAFGRRGLTAEVAFIELFNLKTRQLSHLLGGDKIFAPRRSPDGGYIIAISAGNNKLMLYDVKTEKWRQLNTTPDFFGYLPGLKTAPMFISTPSC
jgi:Tol biopolymer transport system component